jgi:exo-1,4-beta-D-glucosaminidase
VPSTVLTALIRSGVYPDPYVGMNNMKIPDACDAHNERYDLARFSHLGEGINPWGKPYWFRTEFAGDAAFRGRQAWLHFDGINYRADIWLNGRKLAGAGETAGMFRRFSFEVAEQLQFDRPNALCVRIHPLDFPGDPVREELDGMRKDFGPNGGDGQILRNTTQYCTVGWDWIPAARDRNMGIWQHVWLEATGPVTLSDAAVVTEFSGAEPASVPLRLRCFARRTGRGRETVTLTTRIESIGYPGEKIEFSAAHEIPPGETELTITPEQQPDLVLRRPRLWWPVGYGEQPLYRLTLEARIGGAVSHVLSRRFGVRTVGTRVLASGGRAWMVNGRTIRITGGAWVPDFLLNWDAQRYRDEIRLMAEGHHTVIRINGCGIIAPDILLDACDEKGVLIWQDLSRTSTASPWTPLDCDAAIFLPNIRDSVRRLRGHASLLVWCGCNEAPSTESLGRPIQDEILPALDGTRPWLPSSSDDVPWAREKNHTWTGGPWHAVRLSEYFRLYREDPQFTSRNEIGLASPPRIDSIAQFAPDDVPNEEDFPLSQTLAYHDAAGAMYRRTHELLTERFGWAASLNDYLWMADVLNEMGYRGIFEAANKYRPRNSGTHLWKVNAAWPGFMWQVFDWYLRCNAGYEGMRSACRPLHVQHAADDQTLHVVSTLAKPLSGLQVQLKVTDLAGKTEHEQVFPAEVGADETRLVGHVPGLVRDGRLHFISLTLLDAAGNCLEKSVTWYQDEEVRSDLLLLSAATVTAEIGALQEKAGEWKVDFEIANGGAIPAAFVSLSLFCSKQGREILPVFWTENSFTLLPGEKKSLTACFRADSPASLRLRVQGWNVEPVEVSLDSSSLPSRRVGIKNIEVRNGGEETLIVASFHGEGDLTAGILTHPAALYRDGNLVRNFRVESKGHRLSESRLRLGKGEGLDRLEVKIGDSRVRIV